MANEEREKEVHTACEIMTSPYEREQSISYDTVLPADTVRMFEDRLVDFMDDHATRLDSDGEIIPSSQRIVDSKSRYSSLRAKLGGLLDNGTSLVRFSCNGREVDVLAEVIFHDTGDYYEDGYERYFSEEQRILQKRNAFAFLDFLDAFDDAGGGQKQEHRARYLWFLSDGVISPANRHAGNDPRWS